MAKKKTKGGISPKSSLAADSIEAQLANFALELYDIQGDGNCLFRSISHQMEGKQTNHLHYRSEIVKHMRSNKDLYAPFMHEDETMDQRLKRMEKQGVYGDNLEIVACSRAFKVGIVIHQVGQSPWVVDACGEDGEGNAPDRRIIHIVYHSWEHYSSVVPGTRISSPSVSSVSTSKKAGKTKESETPLSIKERIVLNSIPKHLDGNLETVRRLLKEYDGDIGKVVEAFVAQVYAYDDEVGDENQDEEGGNDVALNGIDHESTPVVINSSSNEITEVEMVKEAALSGSKQLETDQPCKKKEKKPSAKDMRAEKKKARKENALAKKRQAASKSENLEPSTSPQSSMKTLNTINSLAEGIKATFI